MSKRPLQTQDAHAMRCASSGEVACRLPCCIKSTQESDDEWGTADDDKPNFVVPQNKAWRQGKLPKRAPVESEDEAFASSDRFAISDRVKIHSLTGPQAPSLNGVSGVIKSFVAETQRFVVLTNADSHGFGGREVAIRPTNLALAAPRPHAPPKLPSQPQVSQPQPRTANASAAAKRAPRVPDWKVAAQREAFANGVALAEHWRRGVDSLHGYVAMEKYDGYRALWDGRTLLTRHGRTIPAPPSLTRLLPTDTRLDGELWMGRVSEGGGVEKAMASFYTSDDAVWNHITYIVFDAPSAAGGFVERLEYAAKRLAESLLSGTGGSTETGPGPSGAAMPAASPRVRVTSTEACEDAATVRRLLACVEARGGEGLILRRADAPFRAGRSRDLLKVKSIHTAEAVVVGWKAEKNSLHMRCQQTEALFDLSWGRGSERPPVGTVLTYKYMARTSTGGPKHASIVCVHGKERRA